MKIITNSLESGDWIIIKDISGRTIWSGHSVRAFDLVSIFTNLGMAPEYVETDDEEIQTME